MESSENGNQNDGNDRPPLRRSQRTTASRGVKRRTDSPMPVASPPPQPTVDREMELHLRCAICYGTLRSPTMMISPCLHRFCNYCIRKWKTEKNQCPSCKCPIENLKRDNFVEEVVSLFYNRNPDAERNGPSEPWVEPTPVPPTRPPMEELERIIRAVHRQGAGFFRRAPTPGPRPEDNPQPTDGRPNEERNPGTIRVLMAVRMDGDELFEELPLRRRVPTANALHPRRRTLSQEPRNPNDEHLHDRVTADTVPGAPPVFREWAAAAEARAQEGNQAVPPAGQQQQFRRFTPPDRAQVNHPRRLRLRIFAEEAIQEAPSHEEPVATVSQPETHRPPGSIVNSDLRGERMQEPPQRNPSGNGGIPSIGDLLRAQRQQEHLPNPDLSGNRGQEELRQRVPRLRTARASRNSVPPLQEMVPREAEDNRGPPAAAVAPIREEAPQAAPPQTSRVEGAITYQQAVEGLAAMRDDPLAAVHRPHTRSQGPL